MVGGIVAVVVDRSYVANHLLFDDYFFSSLTPHATGPNTAGGIRKAYIVQFAPDGAAVLTGDPGDGAPTGRVPADTPSRQFPILVGGAPVPAQPDA